MTRIRVRLERFLEWVVEPSYPYQPKHRAEGSPIILWGRR